MKRKLNEIRKGGTALLKRKLNEIIYTISRYTEIVLSAVMLLVIITLIVPMLYNFLRIPLLNITPEQFTEFLGNALESRF